MTGRCRDEDSTHWLSMRSTHPILVEPLPADVSRDEGASCAMFAALANRPSNSGLELSNFHSPEPEPEAHPVSTVSSPWFGNWQELLLS